MRRRVAKSKLPPHERKRDILREVHYRGVGGIASPDNQEFLQWETYLERLALRTLLLCYDVTNVVSQPSFQYTDETGTPRRYTPDIQLQHGDRTIHIEVKVLLRILAPDTRERLAALSSIFKERGETLAFLTDDQLPSPEKSARSKNVNLLARYKNHPIPQHDVERLLRASGSQPTVAELIIPERREESLAAIYAMVAQKHLWIDFDEPLSEASRIALPHQGYGGLSYAYVSTSGRHGPVLERLVLEGGPNADRCLAAEAARRQQRSHHGPQLFW